MARICHLTLLNPATHTRIFAKIARSQHTLGFEVIVVGQDQKNTPYTREGIQVFPIKPFRRLSLQRILSQIRILRIGLKIHADIYTLHTPELILVALFLRWRLDAKIIYDVHEDYAANIRYGNHYPAFARKLLAGMVRFLEKRFIKYTAAISFAENCYEGILAEPGKKRFFLRNKFQFPEHRQPPDLPLPVVPYMLYSGTIAEDWGIFETVSLWEKLNQIQPIHLVVAGFCQNSVLLRKLQKDIDKSGLKDRFQLIGGDKYVEHHQIMYLIQNCAFGAALYRTGVHIRGKIPTKFYEYMAFGKPLVFTDDPFWNELNRQLKLGLSYTDSIDIQSFWDNLKTQIANPEPHRKEDFLWSGEERELRRMLDFVIGTQKSIST
ncbi:MAG: glycosyltransferase [Bacteroidia bacterium]|nr:glycosyltransferase [Bacteroidia bacterium]